MGRNLGQQIALAFERLLDAFLSVVPAVLVLLAALLVGVLTGLLLRTFLRLAIRLRRRVHGEELSGSRQLLRAAGFRADPELVAGTVSFWTAVVVALAVGVNALEPGALRNVLSEAVGFLPRLLGASLLVRGLAADGDRRLYALAAFAVVAPCVVLAWRDLLRRR